MTQDIKEKKPMTTEGAVRYFDVSITISETDAEGNFLDDNPDANLNAIDEDANMTLTTAHPSPVREIIGVIVGGLGEKITDVCT